ncbi:PAS domain-containing protein [Oceanibaculum pacificum]|uniref:PAS domain-containing protein n=1 Tax=Oceanibaculum pacificum TaxID=580166 RepID=UPI000A04BE57|nr:PAS domain-containing protein [Oceanibaculum pacificum]
MHISYLIDNQALSSLHLYWRSLKLGKALPSRHDFVAEDVWSWIGHIGLLDVEREPLRFRIRLQGNHLARLTGFDATGRYLDEVALPLYHDEILAQHRRATETGEPVYASHIDESRPWKRIDRLILPFATDGRTVDLLMTGLYMAVEPWHGYHGTLFAGYERAAG